MLLPGGSIVIDFFIKPKQIVIDCFTSDPNVFNFFKIEQSAKYLPTWHKNVPKLVKTNHDFVQYVDRPTIRSCYGITEYYKSSYAIRLWSDLILTSDNNSYGYCYADNKSLITTHSDYQTNNYFQNEYHHLKIVCPWLFKSSNKVKFLLSEPFWSKFDNNVFSNNVMIHSGVLSFLLQREANINLFIKKEQLRIELQANTTIAHLFPLTEDKILFKHHLVGAQELEQIRMDSATKCFFKNNMKKSEMLYG